MCEQFRADLDSIRRGPMRRLLRECLRVSHDIIEHIIIPMVFHDVHVTLENEIASKGHHLCRIGDFTLRTISCGSRFETSYYDATTQKYHVDNRTWNHPPNQLVHFGNNTVVGYRVRLDSECIRIRCYIENFDYLLYENHKVRMMPDYNAAASDWEVIRRYNCGVVQLRSVCGKVCRLYNPYTSPHLCLDRIYDNPADCLTAPGDNPNNTMPHIIWTEPKAEQLLASELRLFQHN